MTIAAFKEMSDKHLREAEKHRNWTGFICWLQFVIIGSIWAVHATVVTRDLQCINAGCALVTLFAYIRASIGAYTLKRLIKNIITALDELQKEGKDVDKITKLWIRLYNLKKRRKL